MPNQTSPQAVVFDLDGLMFNTEDLYDEVGTELLARRGQLFTAGLKSQMMGRPGRDALRIMIELHGLSDTVESLQAESDEIFAAILPARLATLPGLLDLLDALEAAGIPKAIATSSRRIFLETVLALSSLGPRFRFVLTAEDVTHGKPHPEIYLESARRHGHPAGQILVLEDSENGCRAAVAAGAMTVAVPSRHSCDHDFSGVTLIADSLADARIYGLLGLERRV